MIIRNFSGFINNSPPLPKLNDSDQIVRNISEEKLGVGASTPSGLDDMARKPAKAKPGFDIAQIVQILSVVRDILSELKDIYRLFKNPSEGQQAAA